MRKPLILSICIFVANSIFSQDLIVTNEGDSINCKITKVKEDNIYFTFKHKGEIRSTLLSTATIQDHRFEYFEAGEVPKEKIVGHEEYQRFRVAVNGGYSYITERIHKDTPPDFKDYTKELRSGRHFGLDASYYFTEILGFGAKYFVFRTKNNLDNIYLQDSDGNRRYGKMSDDIAISYIGPAFSARLSNASKTNAFLFSLSIGHIGYTNNFALIDYYKMTGNTIGAVYEMGYDIGLSENVSLGFQISSMSGSLSEYKLSDGTRTITVELDRDDFIGISRIDLSVGLRIIL